MCLFKKKKPCAACEAYEKEAEEIDKSIDIMVKASKEMVVEHTLALEQIDNLNQHVNSLHKLLLLYTVWDPYILREAGERDPGFNMKEGPATMYLRSIGILTSEPKDIIKELEKESDNALNEMVDTKDGKKYLN